MTLRMDRDIALFTLEPSLETCCSSLRHARGFSSEARNYVANQANMYREIL
jgi:hypothetical protein